MDETLAFAFGVALHLLVFRSGEWNLYTPHLLIGSVMVNGAAIFALARLTPGTSLLASSRAVSAAFAAVLAGIYTSILVYRALFHRLNRFPGPLPARISNAYVTALKMKKMHLYDDVRQLHKKYGDVVRIGKKQEGIIFPKQRRAFLGRISYFIVRSVSQAE